MLQTISPWFEHKLFLSATPHNSHTRCFTGLLKLLDPVRFNQTNVPHRPQSGLVLNLNSGDCFRWGVVWFV
jgi:hypothetical protein